MSKEFTHEVICKKPLGFSGRMNKAMSRYGIVRAVNLVTKEVTVELTSHNPGTAGDKIVLAPSTFKDMLEAGDIVKVMAGGDK